MAWLDGMTNDQPRRPVSGFLGQLGEALREAGMTEEERRRRQLLPLQERLLQQQLREGEGAYENLTLERANRAAAPGATRNVLDAFQARPGNIDRTGAMDLQENPEAAGIPAPVTPGRPDARTIGDLLARLKNPNDFEVAAKYRPETVKGLGLQTPEALEKAENETAVVPDVGLVNKRTGKVLAPAGRKPKHEIKQTGDEYSIFTTDADGNVTSTAIPGSKGPGSKAVFTRADAEDQVKLEDADRVAKGQKPFTELERRQRYNDLASKFMVGPGAGMVGTGTGLTGAPPGQTPMLAQRPATAAPSEREDLADLDSAEWGLEQVLDGLKSGKLDSVMGGVFKNPTGAAARVGESLLGVGMNDEQRKLLGTLGIQLQSVKHKLLGATRTRPELKDVASSIPDEKSLLTGDTAQQAIPKIQAMLDDLRTKRSAREGTMRGSGVAVPPRQGTPAPSDKAPDRPVRTMRRGADPQYQQLRSLGMTDEQIESKYRLKLVP